MEQTNQLPAAKVSVTEREPESLPDSSSLQNVETGTSKHVETQEEDVSPILRGKFRLNSDNAVMHLIHSSSFFLFDLRLRFKPFSSISCWLI